MPTLMSETTAQTPRTAADVRAWIVGELARSLAVDASAIDTTAPLETLGVDSLAALGLTGGLAGWLDRDLPATLMWDYASIDAMADGLADAPAPPRVPAGVVELQPMGEGVPLFCFPGEKGHPATFAPLAARLGPMQPCFGLVAPGLHGEQEPLSSVEAIAAVMVERLRAVQPVGPYQLAGYSFGGHLAYEAARQLRAAGETVSLLAIYDTFTAAGRVRRPAWQALAIRAYDRVRRPGLLRWMGECLQQRPRVDEKTLAAARTAAKDRAEGLDANTIRVRDLNTRATEAYRPGAFTGTVVLFRATQRAAHSRFFRMEPDNGWGALARGGVRVIDLPGTHANLLDAPRAAGAAAALRPFLAAVPR